MGANELQALLRFLSQDAKVPLATAMASVKELQKADLDSPEKLSKLKATDLTGIFPDEKVAKQIITAAKRVSKKRAAGDDAPSPQKKRRGGPASTDPTDPEALEESLALPECDATEDELKTCVVVTNRAPLVLAFACTLLKHTMPDQPLSSRLSLAQGYVSTTSRARAVSLGIQDISKDEEAQEARLGEGQPRVTIMGKELRVLKRWGYEWRADVKSEASEHAQAKREGDDDAAKDDGQRDDGTETESGPALWALDLEALRRSNSAAPVLGGSNLPIYTPQSARAYLLKSFDSPPASEGAPAKKPSTKARAAVKEENAGKLLKALDILYASWAETLSPDELDKRTWSWYVKVRPDVESGVAGWGGKNGVALADILALKRAD